MSTSRRFNLASVIALLKRLCSVPQGNSRLLAAQYQALARQIPLMYFILLVNSWALAFTHMASSPVWLTVHIPVVLSVISIARALAWRRGWHRQPDENEIAQALGRTNRICCVVAVGFTVWALALFPYGDSYAKAHVAFYMAITVIGCIFCLMHLRSAALMTAAVVNVAFVGFFASTDNPTFIATSVNVVLVTAIMLVVLQNNYRNFTGLVNAQARAEALSDENFLLANKDSLTGLPNRRWFFNCLDTCLAQAGTQGQRLSVGILDLDGFKPVNDLYGHSVGDRLLAEVGTRLAALVPDTFHVARLGGDEFALIVPDCGDNAQISLFAERICLELSRPYLLVDVPIQVGASMGLATFPDLASNPHELFEYADYALYHSKRHFVGHMSLFSALHKKQLQSAVLTEQALRRADLAREFNVAFQPIIELQTGATVAFEALARWQSAELGPVPPSQFIPVAERSGMINRLTLPLLATALRGAAAWPAPIRLSFNLSAHDCGSPEAVQAIVRLLASGVFDPRRVDLEITETATLQDLDVVQEAIATLRQLGCGISLDDFGTGYSSLSHLHALALTKLKVDRSFVARLHEKPASYKIVKSLLALTQDMGLDCIFEGVETREEAEALAAMGCRFVQGYYFARPMSAEDTASWLAHTQNRLE
jgi:diguanylate cyclase (GGDEF)-like protein